MRLEELYDVGSDMIKNTHGIFIGISLIWGEELLIYKGKGKIMS